MSKLTMKDHGRPDHNVVQRLHQEIVRNTQEMTYNFWQEYELMRNLQRRRLTQGRELRQRINNMVRTIDDENNQQAEAISRSISVHGMSINASSVSLTPPARTALVSGSVEDGHTIITPEIRQQLRNSLIGTGATTTPTGSNPAPQMQVAPQRRSNQKRRSKSKPQPNVKVESNASPSPAISLNIPGAPPTSRATIVSSGNSRFASSRTTPLISKYQLAKKPKQ